MTEEQIRAFVREEIEKALHEHRSAMKFEGGLSSEQFRAAIATNMNRRRSLGA